jgi:DNA-directed RNA polymerase specialized sigma24 family protein
VRDAPDHHGDQDGDAVQALAAQHLRVVLLAGRRVAERHVGCLGTTLSSLESDALRLYLDGKSYDTMAVELDCDTKTIDNALQRVKRKIVQHQTTRAVPA